MPRNPLAGIVSGAFGLAWAAVGLVLAAWAATTALDTGRGFDLALAALQRSPFTLPWDPVHAANWTINHLLPFAIAAAIALLLGWSNLRTARIAFRPWSHSQDGKGELQVDTREDPRVGRPYEGAIRLQDPPAPGEEFEVVLSGGKPGSANAYRTVQKVRARQGAHGVNLPFRFDVPATAEPSGLASRWRLEFAPAGAKALRRSAFEVKLAPAPAHEVRMVQAPMVGASRALASSPAATHGYADHLEKLYGAMGGKLSDAQRERLRTKLAGVDGDAARKIEGLRQITPQHVKLIKYAFIAFMVLFFVLPFALSVLGFVLAAIFGN